MRTTAALPLLVAALASTACGRTQDAAAKPGGQTRPALSVRLGTASVQDVVYDVKALGSLEAEEIVRVTAEVEGAVDSVQFNEGDRVTVGTVLARIDPNRYRLEAARAEGTYKKALADQHRAEADLVRREELARQQLVAVEELNRSRGETERVSAEAEAAKAAWDWAVENYRRSEVRPSRAGIVNTRSVQTGQYVKVGEVLATLVDLSRLRLRFNVSEAESMRAREGGAVGFRVASLGSRDFSARIYHVGKVADPATRQVEILGWVKNPGPLKPGFFAEVSLATEASKPAVVVPEGAVQASEKGFVVYAVENGKARLRPVQIGLRTRTGVVEIVSGLTGGETVVVEGSDRLSDGVVVQAVSAAR